MEQSQVYVIIVTYNGLQWVDACLGSLRRSTAPLHTVVVDNCSTDGTADAIAERFPEVHLIRSKENLRFGRGNNVGIRYAREHCADYYFLLNQDAWIYPDTIARLLAADDERCGLLSPVHLNGTGEKMDFMFRRYLFKGNKASNKTLLEGFTAPREVDFVNAAAWLLPRRTIECVGGFDPLFSHYGEDNNYCHRILHHGLVIRVVPGARICHDRTPGGNKLQTAWVGRYLTIAYADPRYSGWRITRNTLSMQLNLLLFRLPAYLLRGRRAEARAIITAYGDFFRRRREIAQARREDAKTGALWL